MERSRKKLPPQALSLINQHQVRLAKEARVLMRMGYTNDELTIYMNKTSEGIEVAFVPKSALVGIEGLDKY